MSMGSTAPSTSTSILLFVHFALMAAFCLLLLRACFSSAPLKTVSSRKVLVAMENPPLLARNAVEAVVGGSENGEGYGGEMAASESELRRVPSGPDPLHHHGSTPRKPDDQNNVPPNP